MNRIITIGREFGSGGREMGRRLAEELGIAYYDQEILEEIAKRTDLSEKYIHGMVEKRPSFSFPIHVGRSFRCMQNGQWELNLAVFREQSAIITDMANTSDCVIVGTVCGLYFGADASDANLCACGYGQQAAALPEKGRGR